MDTMVGFLAHFDLTVSADLTRGGGMFPQHCDYSDWDDGIRFS